jgi:hypothetical protein
MGLALADAAKSVATRATVAAEKRMVVDVVGKGGSARLQRDEGEGQWDGSPAVLGL